MIQIIGLRYFTPKDSEDGKEVRFNKLFTTVPTIERVFSDIDSIIESIPASERYNLFYTVAHCKDPQTTDNKLRIFESQEIIPFDIDNIDTARLDDYSRIFYELTGLDAEKTGESFSGNGLQFAVKTLSSFTDRRDFKYFRLFYKAIRERYNAALEKEGLPGDMDLAVWKEKSLMRLPNTENRKKNKGVKHSVLRRGNIEAQNFDWHGISGIKKVNAEDHLPKWNEKNNSTIDSTEIFKKCGVISELYESPGDIREPHFYAAISILARMTNGKERVHRLQQAIAESGSDSSVVSYTPDQVDKKIENSLESSGPHTCKSFSQFSEKCKECPLNGKITSPIQIKSSDFIATKETGFHYTASNGRRVPVYADLRKYFDELHPHISMESSGLIYRYEDGHYKYTSKNFINAFAEKHFNPQCTNAMSKEFLGIMQRTNVKPDNFFDKTSEGFLNVSNGVLNIRTGELAPHSEEYGFRYKLAHPYDPSAKSERFKAFLNDVMDGNQDKIKILEEFGGYALAGGRYEFHKFLMLTGRGRNGKGTFVDILNVLAGEDNVSHVPVNKMEHENHLQLLEGKLFNFSDEVSAGDLKKIGTIKKMTGEGHIVVKMMWHQPYMTKATAKLIMSCNELPHIPETNVAITERLLLVEFKKTYSKELGNIDTKLKQKLYEELSGILNIFLDGYRRLQAQGGFTHSVELERASAAYMMENNPILEWMEESGDFQEKPLNGRCSTILINDAYEMFSEWNLKRDSREIPMTSFAKKFASSLKFLGQRKRKRRMNWGDARPTMTFYDDLVLRGKTRSPENIEKIDANLSIISQEHREQNVHEMSKNPGFEENHGEHRKQQEHQRLNLSQDEVDMLGID